MDEFFNAAEASFRRFEINFDSICAKYGKEFPDSDVVCLQTGKILGNQGTVKNLKTRKFGTSRLAITKRRADKLQSTLSQSNLDLTSHHDNHSIYSNYVSGSVNQSHFADDATKVLSFIQEENEPSDAETISSGESSNGLEEISSGNDSCLDQPDSNSEFAKCRGEKARKEWKGRGKGDDFWYSLGTSSDDDTDVSHRKAFGSSNSRSRDNSKDLFDGSCEKYEGNVNRLSVGNVERFHLTKQHTEDSGFESGASKHVLCGAELRPPVRMFCFNDDKINRVMSWVKDQAKETENYEQESEVSNQQANIPEDNLRSPSKLRKLVPLDEKHLNPAPRLPASPQTCSMNKTFTVPSQNQAGVGKTCDKENRTCSGSVFSKLNESASILIENCDETSVDERNESGSLTPRRIMRARKRAFTPVQPSYSNEQIHDFLTSTKPHTFVEILSPSRPRGLHAIAPDVSVPTPPPTPESYSPFPQETNYRHSPQQHHQKVLNLQPVSSPCNIQRSSSIQSNYDPVAVQKVRSLQSNNLNNLNKDITKDTNETTEDVLITRVKLEPDLDPGFPTSVSNMNSPLRHHMHKQVLVRSSVADDAITLCEGFAGGFSDHTHIMSPVPQTIRSPLLAGARPEGQCRSAGSKKDIFDRLKKSGCMSDSKVHSEKSSSRDFVRARRQLSMGQTDTQNMVDNTQQCFTHDDRTILRDAAAFESERLPSMNENQNVHQIFHDEMDMDVTQNERTSGNIGSHGNEQFGKHYTMSSSRSGYLADNEQSVKDSLVFGSRLSSVSDLPNRYSASNRHSRQFNPVTNSERIYPNDNRHSLPKFNAASSVQPKLSHMSQAPVAVSSSLSPVCGRKFTNPGQGLSPSSAFSQLQLNSPTHAKHVRQMAENKCRKERHAHEDASIQPFAIRKRSSKDAPQNTPLSDGAKSPRKNILSKDFQPVRNQIDDAVPSSRKSRDSKQNPERVKSSKGDQTLSLLKSATKYPDMSRSPRKPTFPKKPSVPSDDLSLQHVEKPMFLVPDQPVKKGLKAVSSRKKHSDLTTNSLDRAKKNKSQMNLTRDEYVRHLQSMGSSRWTSTPSKSRSVPILNDSMSTIFLGGDESETEVADDEDEVNTLSPYSFRSESVLGSVH